MRNSVFPMILIALCAAIIAVLAQMVIPLPLVPITGQTLAIGLVVTILGMKYGTYAVLLYIGLGVIGLPVFQSFTGGLGVVFGPTGGFIIGFIPSALIMGYYLEKTSFTFVQAMVANVIAMLITLTFGSIWLKFIADLSWVAAFSSGFLPFIIPGILKASLAAWVGIIVRQRLIQARLLTKLTHS